MSAQNGPSNFVPLSALTQAQKKTTEPRPQGSGLRADATASVRGPRYWRTLEEYEGPLEIGEEPQAIDQAPPSEESRRTFLSLMAASMGFAGLTACTRQPTEFIVPYVDPPEQTIPGTPQFFATAVPVNGVAQGVVVESHLGRPTKVEGNPDHPASLGSSDVLSQASVMDLYDPDRAREISLHGDGRSWEDFLRALTVALDPVRAKKGEGFRILTETVTSPTLGDRIQAVLMELPSARWHQWDPAGCHSARAGSQLAFGKPVNTYYRLENADVIVALDSDFLACGPGSTRYARDYSTRRRRGDRTGMNRLYAIESSMTATGGKADHRLPLRYAEVETFARELSQAVSGQPAQGGRYSQWTAAIARDLTAHRGTCAIIPGDHQSPAVHALAHGMNAALGNAGQTVIYTDPIEVRSEDQNASIQQLASDLNAGMVDVLLILGGNPAYNAPVDLNFPGILPRAKFSAQVGLHADETASYCQWHVPESHFLEEWGDARSFDGTVSILQPLILPLYESHSYLRILDAVIEYPGRAPYDIVRAYWMNQGPGAKGAAAKGSRPAVKPAPAGKGAAPASATAAAVSPEFEARWRKSLHDGFIDGTALPETRPALSKAPEQPARQTSSGGIEVVFRPDPYILDGRYANNIWLQELPRPMTKLTWDNAVILSPATAKRLGIKAQELVELRRRDRSVRGSVCIQPGHPDGTTTVHLGFGRTRSGRAGNGAGFNAYLLRTSDAMWSAGDLEIRKTGESYPLATTQMQQWFEGHQPIIGATADEYRARPDFVREAQETPERALTIYPPWNYSGYAWGMSIDLTACVNCQACVVACQAENNIAVVGKQEILARRGMHWLRIDTYYDGGDVNPKAHYQPIPCMQCEDAPCEYVCPVHATVHSAEGLNDMTYNRCIGTRYCSNNCPYKVRRFNFFLFQDWTTETLKLQRNPDVTVRSRGVMEKCTYCVQRIREVDIRARIGNRFIADGEIQTACMQACPTQAIVFGDINNRANRVARLKALNLNYALAAELNTRPRTTYLAELRNPNPELNEASHARG
ncbi:MAG TPA: Fe-S-cluster-containing hydrogenase [Bryobacteraceae bacterium]|jgi:molybdopterin-containing oxidoreductase family iron-sulfur binding subunit